MPVNLWICMRAAMVIGGAVVIAFSGRLPQAEHPLDESTFFMALILAGASSLFAFFATVNLYPVARLFGLRWRFPDWSINPLWPLDALQVFHLLGACIGLSGILMTIHHRAAGLNGSSGLLLLSVGCGVLSGDYGAGYYLRAKKSLAVTD